MNTAFLDELAHSFGSDRRPKANDLEEDGGLRKPRANVSTVWPAASARLTREQYEKEVRSYWGETLQLLAANSGVPLEELIHTPNESIARAKAIGRAKEEALLKECGES